MRYIVPGEIMVKSVNVLEGMLRYRMHPKLIPIVEYIARHWGLVVTEFHRHQKHPNDLHGVFPVRAIDLRTWCYPAGIPEAIVEEVNDEWEYDPKRPGQYKVAQIHNVGQGIHFHIQVHHNTIRRG